MTMFGTNGRDDANNRDEEKNWEKYVIDEIEKSSKSAQLDEDIIILYAGEYREAAEQAARMGLGREERRNYVSEMYNDLPEEVKEFIRKNPLLFSDI